MRLDYSSNNVTDTALVDDASGRTLYATSTSKLGYETEVLKYEETEPANLAVLKFPLSTPDVITLRGQDFKASGYLMKPSFMPYYRRFFTTESGMTYEWNNKGETWTIKFRDGQEVGRSHSRSLGIIGSTKHKPYLELVDDPMVLKDLDEIIVTYFYVDIKRKKDNGQA